MPTLLYAGFSAASEGAYPTRVNPVIPETVGSSVTVRVLNEKLTSPVEMI